MARVSRILRSAGKQPATGADRARHEVMESRGRQGLRVLARWRGSYCRPWCTPGFPRGCRIGSVPARDDRNQDMVNSQHGGVEGERDAPGSPGAHVGPGRVPDVSGARRADCL